MLKIHAQSECSCSTSLTWTTSWQREGVAWGSHFKTLGWAMWKEDWFEFQLTFSCIFTLWFLFCITALVLHTILGLNLPFHIEHKSDQLLWNECSPVFSGTGLQVWAISEAAKAVRALTGTHQDAAVCTSLFRHYLSVVIGKVKPSTVSLTTLATAAPDLNV